MYILELISFVKGSGVEVYVKRDWLGLVTVEQQNEWNVVLSYKEVGKKDRTRMVGVYLKPNRSIDYLNRHQQKGTLRLIRRRCVLTQAGALPTSGLPQTLSLISSFS